MTLSVSLFGFAPSLPRNAVPTAAGVTISVSPALDISAFFGTSFGALNPAFEYLGGESAILGPAFPQQSFMGTFNLTYSTGARSGLGGVVAFKTDAQSFDVIAYAAGFASQFDIFVDGILLRGAAVSLPSDGSIRRVTIDYTAAGFGPGLHKVELVYNGSTAFGGIHVPSGSIVTEITDPAPRLVVLGDSFTEGTGAIDYANGFAKLVGRYLGITDTWASGLGGTGYEATLANRPNLDARITSDGVDAQGQIYVVAMGLNDSNASATLEATVMHALGTLVAGAPNARIFVVGPWNPQAALAYPKEQVEAIIAQVASHFPNVVFLDPSTIPFTKVDPTHPDQAGHQVLAEWLTEQIRSAMAADGVVEQGVAGDIVGPLAVAGWLPGTQYSYAVYENGAPSSRFEVVDNGSAFPVLKLKPDVAIAEPGKIQVEIHVQTSADASAINTINFDVRPHFQGSGLSETLVGQSHGSSLAGAGGDDVLIGTAGADLLDGGSGNDWLDGRGDVDLMRGGPGDDYYLVDSYGDIVEEVAGEGEDSIYTALPQFALRADIENLVLLGAALDGGGNELGNFIKGDAVNNRLTGFGGDDRLSGEAGDDVLLGGSGNDYLAGGAGTDFLSGGTGNDAYLIEDTLDTIADDGGKDTVFSSLLSFALPTEIEQLVLIGGALDGSGNNSDNLIDGNAADNRLFGLEGNDQLNGAGGDDQLWGGAGNDYLDGGAGLDRLAGETGDDSYVVDRSDDRVIEMAGEGYDTIFSQAASFLLPFGIERGIAVGAASTIVGNDADNVIWGSSQDNVLDGGAGDDSIDGNGGNDTVYGSDGNDQIFGGSGDDLLAGGTGNDWLIGSSGNDRLEGGTGNDYFLVLDAGDVVIELADGGTDWVYSEVASYTLGDNVERLSLNGPGPQDGYGNALDNLLAGNAQANVLSGGAGGDYIDGGGGNDTLLGGTGNDWLIGGFGMDRLEGGSGDDYYVVLDLNDDVIEQSDDGTDWVYSEITSYTLADNVERLKLHGTGPQDGYGNALNNLLAGNAQTNLLSGGSGDDYIDGGDGDDTLLGGPGSDFLLGNRGSDNMSAGDGNDTYQVDDTSDVVSELSDGGIDAVWSELMAYALGPDIENLRLTGSTSVIGTGNGLDNAITGNSLDNLLDGLAGNDYLDGGAGNDTLTGGAGNDWLVGGAGFDRGVFDAAVADFMFQFYADGSLAVRNVKTGEIDRVLDVEVLSFGNDQLTIDWASQTLSHVG